MLPKNIREQKQEAKKSLLELKRIIKRMEKYLHSSDTKAIEIAAAFMQIVKHHVMSGDLTPEDVHLAAMLRRNNGTTGCEDNAQELSDRA